MPVFSPPRKPRPGPAGLARPSPSAPDLPPAPLRFMPTRFFTARPPTPRLLVALFAAARLAHFRAIPADRLLVETDAPLKAPAPDRNRFPLGAAPDGTVINHPANVVVASAPLAKLRGVPLDDLAAQVATNFTHLSAPESPH